MNATLCVIAGMPRAGTTFLYHNLQRHPDVFAAYRKEVNFFTVHHDRGRPWYDRLYGGAAPGQVRLDVTPLCFMTPGSENRIADLGDEARVVLVVRRPSEWILSLHAQLRTVEFDVPPFADFVNGYTFKRGRHALDLRFLDTFVPARLETFMTVLGRRLLVLPFELLRRDPLHMLRSFETFLDIGAYFRAGTFDPRVINASGRRNVKLAFHLLTRERTIAAIGAILPRSLILGLRRRFDAWGEQPGMRRREPHRDDDRALSRRLFKDQDHEIDRMLEHGDAMLGDGSPFAVNQAAPSREPATETGSVGRSGNAACAGQREMP